MSQIRTEPAPTVIAIETLKVDVKFGPVEEKVEQLFLLSFSIRCDPVIQWDTTYKFSKFAELQKIIQAAAPNFITTDFPKAHRSRQAFGVKLSEETLQSRRNYLNLWLREVIANYDLLPDIVQVAIIEFLNVPPYLNIDFSTRDLIAAGNNGYIDGHSGSVSDGGEGLRRRNSARRLSLGRSTSKSSITAASDHAGARDEFTPRSTRHQSRRTRLGTASIRASATSKIHSVSTFFLTVHERLAIVWGRFRVLHTRQTETKALCISRNEHVTNESTKPILRAFVEDLCSSYGFVPWLLVVTVLVTCTEVNQWSYPLRIIFVCVFALLCMLYHDQQEMHIHNETQRKRQLHGTAGVCHSGLLQACVAEFTQSREAKYCEYLAPMPFTTVASASPRHSMRRLSRSNFGASSSSNNNLPLIIEANSTTTSTADAKPSRRNDKSERSSAAFASDGASVKSVGSAPGIPIIPSSEMDDSSALSNSGKVCASSDKTRHQSLGASAHGGGTSDKQLSSQKEARESSKQRMLAARKLFDEFEFPDLSPAARAMYVDRKFTHNFQVRGPNYLDDKKKIHPGSAICKLMLLELYEVESKDGDRHDHIAMRGVAKKRLQTIQALPGNPFVFMINFQIPGDPPISIVTYFALPPDLTDRYAEGEMDKWQSLFGRFINLPVNETERLAAWGVTSASSSTAATEESEAESGCDDNGGGVGGGTPARPRNAQPASTSPASTAPATGGGWMKMPSDISWPEPKELGALPPTDFRNMRFKLIPSVTEGPWVVKAAVRSQPALLGRKVVQRYFRGDGYMEIDVHVGSSVIASQVVGVCRGYGKHFAADVGIVIQGEDPSELPEKMLGCVSFHKIDVDVRQKLD